MPVVDSINQPAPSRIYFWETTLCGDSPAQDRSCGVERMSTPRIVADNPSEAAPTPLSDDLTPGQVSGPSSGEMPSPRRLARLKAALFGRARDLHDQRIFHQVSLIPFLAWVGLGADGLSSSAYGPEEAFKTLGAHKYLAVGLALLMASTELIISAAYRRIIEAFP